MTESDDDLVQAESLVDRLAETIAQIQKSASSQEGYRSRAEEKDRIFAKINLLLEKSDEKPMTQSSADETLNRVAENLEVLTEQVGRMTEGITRLENLVTNGFTELKDQTAVRDAQINRLIGVVEQLISRN